MRIFFTLTVFLSFSTIASLKNEGDYEKYIHNIYLKHYKNPVSHSDWNNKIKSLPQKYKLKTKDNLWDLSGSFLKDSLYWSKIWVANPQVENPHSIYRGDFIKFDHQTLMAANNSKHSVDIQSQFPNLNIPQNKSAKKALQESEIPSSLPETSNFQNFDHSIDTSQMQIIDIGTTVLVPFYLTNSVPSKEGEIISKLSYGNFIGLPGEELILKINGNVSIGSLVTVFENKGRVGNLFDKFSSNTKEIMIKGQVKISSYLPSAGDSFYVGSVMEAMQVISPGDSVFISSAPTYKFSQKGPQGKTQGSIIGSSNRNKDLLSLGSVVYLDKGFNEGVKVGEIFYIQGKTKPSLKRPRGYKLSPLGKLQIIHTESNSSTGIIFESKDRIFLGDGFSGDFSPLKILDESEEHEQLEESETLQEGQDLFIDLEEVPEEEEELEEVPTEDEEEPFEGPEEELEDLEEMEEIPAEDEEEIIESADSQDLETEGFEELEEELTEEESEELLEETDSPEDFEEEIEESEEFWEDSDNLEEELLEMEDEESEEPEEELKDFEDLENL